MIIFHFIFKMLWKPILKVELSRIFLNASTCTRCLILQNGPDVDEILIFQKFQVNGALKDTYVLLNYACYNYNISKNLIWSRFEHNFDPISFKCTFNLLLWYQSCSNFQDIFNLFSCVHIKNCLIFWLDFGWTTFFVYFALLTFESKFFIFGHKLDRWTPCPTFHWTSSYLVVNWTKERLVHVVITLFHFWSQIG